MEHGKGPGVIATQPRMRAQRVLRYGLPKTGVFLLDAPENHPKKGNLKEPGAMAKDQILTSEGPYEDGSWKLNRGRSVPP